MEGLLAELNFPSLQAGATEPTVVHTDLQYFEEVLVVVVVVELYLCLVPFVQVQQ